MGNIKTIKTEIFKKCNKLISFMAEYHAEYLLINFGSNTTLRDYDFYIVTDWLGCKLWAKGHNAVKDFHGLCIWARKRDGFSVEFDKSLTEIFEKENN
jgi:hypothetical protein